MALALRRRAHAGCRAARPDRTGAVPLGRHGRVLNPRVIWQFPLLFCRLLCDEGAASLRSPRARVLQTGEFAVFAIFLPALAESGPAPGGRGWDDAICGVFREAARALRRKAHAGCRAARPDRTGAAPLARQGKILNCVVIYCFPPASRRGRRRFARRVRVCAPWGGALVLLCAAGRPQCVGNRGVQNLPSRPARAGPRPVGAAGTIRFAAVYREAARALQRCGSPRNRRSMRKMAAFCFSSPL